MKPLARIARLSAAFVCSNLARAAIGLALALVLGRGLGAARFGAWVLCTAWASTVTVVADLGFGVLLTRDGARDESDPAALLAGALVLRLMCAVPLAAGLAIAAPWLSADADVVAGVRIAAVLGVAGAGYGCFGALLRSQPRWIATVLAIETACLALQVPASWWIVSAGRGVGSLLELATVVQLAQIGSALAMWPFVFGAGRRSGASGPRQSFTRLLRRALPFAASGLVANLQARVGPLMLGALGTPVDVGWFGAASRVGRAIKLAPQAVLGGALPVLAGEYGRDRAVAARVSRTIERGLEAASTAGVVVCAAAAPFLMRAIFGAPFAGAAPTLIWIAAGIVPALGNSARRVFLYAAGEEAVALRWSAAALALQAIGGGALIPAFGSSGAALALAIGEAAVWWPLRRAAYRFSAVNSSSNRAAVQSASCSNAHERAARATSARREGSSSRSTIADPSAAA